VPLEISTQNRESSAEVSPPEGRHFGAEMAALLKSVRTPSIGKREQNLNFSAIGVHFLTCSPIIHIAFASVHRLEHGAKGRE
jgi:hypothetical protein